ncbi:MAG: hypothetical protein LRZ85_04465 [Alphaproteobacteria bacterium]|nr:hypothetical protein [Alphaproteobacteria bacterium]MCD8571477.1 hypothetical protein [Alphaproteobacteria bacterium]
MQTHPKGSLTKGFMWAAGAAAAVAVASVAAGLSVYVATGLAGITLLAGSQNVRKLFTRPVQRSAANNIAGGAAIMGYAAATDYPVGVLAHDWGSILLSTLNYAANHSAEILVAGFAGALGAKVIRNSLPSRKVRYLHRTFAREGAGSFAGVLSFLLGERYVGQALSGSKYFNPERLQNIAENEGWWQAFKESGAQKSELVRNAGEQLNNYIQGHQTAGEILQQWFQKAPPEVTQNAPDFLEKIYKAMEIPDVKASAIVFATSVAMGLSAYFLTRWPICTSHDFDDNGQPIVSRG